MTSKIKEALMLLNQCHDPDFIPAHVYSADEINDMMAELEKDGWQPIETAPKDGTEIIIMQTSGCVHRVKWDDGCFDYEEEPPAWVDFQDLTTEFVEKHIEGWIPAPPKTAQEG